jgi:DNA-binding MarR family transcriptional regulator
MGCLIYLNKKEFEREFHQMPASPTPSVKKTDIAESMIPKIMVLLSKISQKFEPGENEMKEWIIKNFDDHSAVEILQDSTLMTLRVLDAVGRLEPVNGITISRQARIPKGSVSKITRRMIAQKLITKESLPNNKKEVLFRVTSLGKKIFVAHQAFDQKMEKGFIQFLKKYTPDELGVIVRVLQDFAEASFLK